MDPVLKSVIQLKPGTNKKSWSNMATKQKRLSKVWGKCGNAARQNSSRY